MPNRRERNSPAQLTSSRTHELNDHWEEGFKSWYKNEHNHEIGEQTNMAARSHAFLRWYIESFLSDNYLISADEIDSFIVDRSNDLGADFVYPYEGDDQSGTLIVQAKYFARRENEESAGIQNFEGLLERLEKTPETAHEKLQEILQEVDWTKPIHLVYLSSNRPTEGTANEMQRIKDKYEESDPKISVDIVTSVQLNEQYRAQKASYRSFNIDHEIPVITAMEFEGSYSVIVSANAIEQLYRAAKREALFQENVRNPLATTLNKKIVDTLRTEPQNFFFYNNGISALVTSALPHIENEKIRSIKVKGIQVINGAQTVASIHKAKLQYDKQRLPKSDFEKARVYLRLIPRDREGEAVEFTQKVIERNNSQNVVKQADFKSRDPIQLWLHNEFKKQRCHNNKQVYYAYRRGNEGRSAEIIKIDVFGMRLMSFLKNPGTLGNSVTKLFSGKQEVAIEEQQQKISWYDVVFKANQPEAQSLSPQEFAIRSAVWWYSDYAENERKKLAKEQLAYLGSVHPILFASRLLLEAKYGKDGAKSIWASAFDGSWVNNKSGLKYSLFSSLFKNAVKLIAFDYGQRVDKVRQQNLSSTEVGKPPKAFNIQAWRRDKEVFEEWERQIGTNPVLTMWESVPQIEHLIT